MRHLCHYRSIPSPPILINKEDPFQIQCIYKIGMKNWLFLHPICFFRRLEFSLHQCFRLPIVIIECIPGHSLLVVVVCLPRCLQARTHYQQFQVSALVDWPNCYAECPKVLSFCCCTRSNLYCCSCAIKLAIWSWRTLSWFAAVCFNWGSSSEMPLGSLREIYWPSPTLISTLADPLPRRFLQTVAITVPGSVAARGDPFWEKIPSPRRAVRRTVPIAPGRLICGAGVS